MSKYYDLEQSPKETINALYGVMGAGKTYYKKKRLKKMEDKVELLEYKINKAIEYIRNNCILSDEWTDLDFCNFVPTGNIKYKQLSSKKVKDLLSILRGEDNE